LNGHCGQLRLEGCIFRRGDFKIRHQSGLVAKLCLLQCFAGGRHRRGFGAALLLQLTQRRQVILHILIGGQDGVAIVRHLLVVHGVCLRRLCPMTSRVKYRQ